MNTDCSEQASQAGSVLSSSKKVHDAKILCSIHQPSLPGVLSQQRVFRRRKAPKVEEQKISSEFDVSVKKSPRKVIAASKEKVNEAYKQQSSFIFPKKPQVISQMGKAHYDVAKTSVTKGPSKKSNQKFLK